MDDPRTPELSPITPAFRARGRGRGRAPPPRRLRFEEEEMEEGPSEEFVTALGATTSTIGASDAEEQFREFGFAAYNLEPKPERAHELPSDIYGPEPNVRTGAMMWQAPDGVTGLVPVHDVPDTSYLESSALTEDVLPDDRMLPPDLYGVSVASLFEEGRVARVDTFRIAYTIMWPKDDALVLNDLPLIGLLHGVPMNRRAKYKTMRRLARFAICVCWDMLGMGESDMPLEYGTEQDLTANAGLDPHERVNYARFNRMWDWKHDIHYVHQLMTQEVPRVMQIRPKPWIFQADDWGTGIAMTYASSQYAGMLRMLFLLNAIMLDGYFVIEIGTIGKLAEMHLRNPKAFAGLAPILPQTIVGIEKYMIQDRKRMNRYTESDYLFPYIDTDYQAGKMAATMHHNEWALLSLANRSSRLAPRQLQPYHLEDNPSGIATWRMRAPVHYIWGWEDQMMPPAQVDRGLYLWPNARHVGVTEIAGADHFVEIDKPDQVVRAMLRAINGTLGLGTTRTMVGMGVDATYKGDEPEIARMLDSIYDAP